MNGNQLDDLFKEKLGNHKLTPPASSWDQIEKKLNEKKNEGNSIGLWFKIAASIVIVFTVGWLLIPTEGEPTTPTTVAEIPAQTSPDTNPVSTSNTSDKQPEIIKPAKDIVPSKNLIVKNEAPNNEASKPLSVGILNEPLIEASIAINREVLPMIPLLKLNTSRTDIFMVRIYPNHVLPLDISLRFSYSEERNEEIKKSRKFRMLNGIISIAKGVNKSKLGFEDIRNAKNGFVNDELKYGVKVSEEDVVEENNTKSDDLNK